MQQVGQMLKPRKNSPKPELHTKAKEKVHRKSPISGGLIKPRGCSKAGNNKAASMMSCNQKLVTDYAKHRPNGFRIHTNAHAVHVCAM